MERQIDVQELKQYVRLEAEIAKHFELIGGGRFCRTREHNSLVIDTETQRFYWNSRDLRGDVYDWLMALHNWDFAEAKEYVARLAGFDLDANAPPPTPQPVQRGKPRPRKLMPPSAAWRRKGREVVAKAEAYLWR